MSLKDPVISKPIFYLFNFSIFEFKSLIASISTATNFSYLTALYPFGLVTTISGKNASISCAIIPISCPVFSCIPSLAIQSNCTPFNCITFSKAFSTKPFTSFNLLSDE
jgi:hypothetical protein